MIHGLLVILIASSINYEELSYSRPNESVYYYPPWANALGWCMTASSVIWVPVVILHRFVKFGFSMEVFKLMLVPYKLKPHQMRPQDKLERCLYDLHRERQEQEPRA